MLGYDFEVVYRPGLENKAADALSLILPTVHLAHLSAPTIIDAGVIKEEVESDPKLKEVIKKVKADADTVPCFS